MLNPVRAKIVDFPEQRQWSSYREILNSNNDSGIVSGDWISAQFSQRKAVARQRYKEFILSGLGKDSPLDNAKGEILLGDKELIEKISSYLEEKRKIKEVPRRERYVSRPKLRAIFGRIESKGDRNRKIHVAHQSYGYTFTGIGVYLGLHYSVVSRAFK